MDFRLTEEQQMICESVKKFGEKWEPEAVRLQQHALKHGEVDRTFWKAYADAGFAGALIPEQYGGTDMGLTAMALIIEGLSAHNLGSVVMMLTAMDSLCIVRAGSESMKERYLPKIAAGEMTFGFAITEADAGSNSFKMKTIARKTGDKLIVNGSKTFITAADVVDRILVVARSMSYPELKAAGLPKTAGFNLVVLDPKAAGVTLQEMPTDGIEGFRQYTLFFDDVELDADELIGEEHRGVFAMFDVLNAERTLASCLSLGECTWLLGKAVAYAKQRVVFKDTPIGAYQAIQHPLAEIRAEQEAARMLIYRAATMFDQGARSTEIGPIANMAKMLIGDITIKAVDRTIQTYGGNGFSRENGLVQKWVNSRLLRTAPISKEMILNHIAEHVLGLPRSY